MKIAEALFEFVYLTFAMAAGVWLCRRKDLAAKLTGLAALVLAGGDAFHLCPRILAAFAPDPELTVWLGLGKMVTSVSMAAFYLILELYRERRFGGKTGMGNVMFVLFLIRSVLCFFPQNGWTSADPSLTWGIIRNIPFVIMGVLTIALWIPAAKRDRIYRFMPLAVALSFLFYLPVVLFAGTAPAVGALMLPKTLMYAWILVMFAQAAEASDGGRTEKETK